MRDRGAGFLVAALVALLPFEPLAPVLGLSLLQWVFAFLVAFSLPGLWQHRSVLGRKPVFIAALAFTALAAVSLLASGPYLANSAKALVRIAAGVYLLAVALTCQRPKPLARVWCGAAVLASAYAIADFAGFGLAGLFRDQEFYVGTVRRLSGSFEYPNAAAAYFAMSLPLLWSVPRRPGFRYAGTLLVWVALVLTFSRGAAVAVLVALAFGAWLSRRTESRCDPRSGHRRWIWLGVASSIVYVVLGLFEPLLIDRLGTSPARAPVAADYEPRFNTLRLGPATEHTLDLQLTNNGQIRWAATGERRVVLAYHWYDTARKVIVDVSPIATELSADVAPGETIEVRARFRTPDGAGLHLLDWDLRQADFGWFTGAGVPPGIVEVYLGEDGEPLWRLGDVSRWYQPERRSIPTLDSTVSRPDLWRAAIGITMDRPILGVGADNYRLLYGQYLGYEAWDQNIRSNSLYFELLATTGLLGLVAFLAVPFSARYRWQPAGLGVLVFFVHGLVDVFLMTTPIYFGFWMLLGLADEDRA